MIFVLSVLLWTVPFIYSDKPCASRDVSGESIVCVCNTTYCDDVTRESPPRGVYVTYTSSKSGLRLKKSKGNLSNYAEKSISFEVNLDTQYQTIEGFGGAVTDAAGINWKSVPHELQDSIIKSYFSDTGSEYNMIRVPIGGTDFSTHAYAYNESPEDDALLSNYTLAPEDNEYKIPMIKAALSYATAPIHIVATTWSPPLWMKTGNEYGGRSELKEVYYQTYADYYLKFLEHYQDNGISIWGITTTNEPINGKYSLSHFNSLGWSFKNMGRWIVENLGPTIRNSSFRDIKIITGDDQRITVPFWFNVMLYEHPKALDYIDGVGVHYYTDKFVSPKLLEVVTKTHPDKFILATEACEGSAPWQTTKVILGSWQRAVNYATDIIEDLNFNVIGWIDWNLCVDMHGGPNWSKNFVDSTIIVNADAKEIYKQPTYYVMVHFSKFIPRASVRVGAKKSFSMFSHIEYVFFLTPRNTLVAIFYNRGNTENISIKCGEKYANIELAAESLTTLEMSNEG